MNVRCFIEIVKSILTMTFTGSIVSGEHQGQETGVGALGSRAGVGYKGLLG